MRITRRRPSPAMVVALIALFVALGGPAEAKKRLIDGGLHPQGQRHRPADQERLGRQGRPEQGAVRSLTRHAGRLGGLGADRRRPGARARSGRRIRGPRSSPPGAVTASKLAADSIGGGSVANGSLQTVDIGSFTGSRAGADSCVHRDEPCQARHGAATPPAVSPTSPTTSSSVSPPGDWADNVVVTRQAGGRATDPRSSPAGSAPSGRASLRLARPDDLPLRHLRRALGPVGRFLPAPYEAPRRI